MRFWSRSWIANSISLREIMNFTYLGGFFSIKDSRLMSTTRFVSYFSALHFEASLGSDYVYYMLWSIFLIYRRRSFSFRLESYLWDFDWFNLCFDFCTCVICAGGAGPPVLFFSLFSIILIYLLMLFKISSQILGILG